MMPDYDDPGFPIRKQGSEDPPGTSKHVFAVVKNNTLYQPNYCSAKPSKKSNFYLFFYTVHVAGSPSSAIKSYLLRRERC